MLTAIVGILLGNFLIATLFAPSLKRLRDVLDKFAQIQLPFESIWPLLEEQPGDDATRRRAAEKATSEFNLYFREYCIAFDPFKRLGYVFVGAILVLVCAVVWQSAIALRIRLLGIARL